MSPVTCPRCGQHGTSVVLSPPVAHARYLCNCSSLHNGTDNEWRRWASARAEYRRYTGLDTPDLTATGGVIQEP